MTYRVNYTYETLLRTGVGEVVLTVNKSEDLKPKLIQYVKKGNPHINSVKIDKCKRLL